jgi:hypothetical protein
MDQNTLISGRDTILIAIPLLLMIFFSLFRLDQIIARPKRPQSRQRPACGIDESGELIVCDPDGRIAGTPRRKRARN